MTEHERPRSQSGVYVAGRLCSRTVTHGTLETKVETAERMSALFDPRRVEIPEPARGDPFAIRFADARRQFKTWLLERVERHGEYHELRGRLALLSSCATDPSAFEERAFYDLWRASSWAEEAGLDLALAAVGDEIAALKEGKAYVPRKYAPQAPGETSIDVLMNGPFLWRVPGTTFHSRRYSGGALFGALMVLRCDALKVRRDWTLVSQFLAVIDQTVEPAAIRMRSRPVLAAIKRGDLRYLQLWPADIGETGADLEHYLSLLHKHAG